MKPLLTCVAALVALTSSHAWAQTSPDTDPFPFSEGWAGGDAAYSIPLDSKTTVWLFGDTFVQKRQPQTMIHNSIAVRTCQPRCTVSYWWAGKGKQKADAFFATPQTNYFWPLDGFVHNGQLYIFLEQMHTTGDGGPMGFDYTGVTLATVSNPHDSPSRWQISYREITRGNQIIPGIAALVDGNVQTGYVHVFTLIRRDPQKPFLGLLRLPLNALDLHPNKWTWQYLAAGNKWLAWNNANAPTDAARLIEGSITEMSVKFHSESNQWAAVFPTPGFPPKTASFNTARTIAGPWTAPRAFFSYPEMSASDPRHTPNVFCYAAKEHPELERPAELAFTYACNSMKEEEIFNDRRLYRPQLVRMGFPNR